jgi:hypothetical protein
MQNGDKSSSIESETIKSEKFAFELYVKQNIVEDVINNNFYIDIFDKKEIFSVQSNKPILVYRHSAFNCDVCVNFGNSKIEEHFPDFKKNSDLLFVISDYPPEHYSSHINALDLKKNKLGLPIENANQPFYFVLINNCIRHIFIPDKSFPSYTDIYLQEVKKRYFKS